MVMSYADLKARHRKERDHQHPNLRLRIHRALSWLQRAEQADDPDGRFIFLWIAFNAAYATDIDEQQRVSERSIFSEFLEKLVSLDHNHCLEELTWEAFPKSIRVLLNTPYVYQSFWDYHRGKISRDEWEEVFARGRGAAQTALGKRDTATVLSITLGRIYTLRNQLVHGGATWNSAVNRGQLQDCVALMDKLVPLVITIMMDNPDTLWGDPCYPVVPT